MKILDIWYFFREFYKLTLNAYIYKPLLAAISGANDHVGLAGVTKSYEKLEKFWKFSRQGEKYILGATVFSPNFSNLKNWSGFLQMMLGKQLAN